MTRRHVEEAKASLGAYAIGTALYSFGVISDVAMAILSAAVSIVSLKHVREMLKQIAFQEYDRRTVRDFYELDPFMLTAFLQGHRASTSKAELIKSYVPCLTPAANLHWKAYYAGLEFAQKRPDFTIIRNWSKVDGVPVSHTYIEMEENPNLRHLWRRG